MTELKRFIFVDDNDNSYEALIQDPIPATAPEQPSPSGPTRDGSPSRTPKGGNPRSGSPKGSQPIPPATRVHLQKVHNTIKGYTHYALGAFKDLALTEVEVEEVTLKISAEGSLPALVSAKSEADFAIEVKCKLNSPEASKTSQAD